MSITSHNLGFPRIGSQREIKQAVESYWQGNLSLSALLETGRTVRQQNWQLQKNLGLDWIPVGDFAWYDHVLNTSTLLGVIPDRFRTAPSHFSWDLYFCMARGQAPHGLEAPPCPMTKWFDTNYHYIVPEIKPNQTFCITNHSLFEEVNEAIALGYSVKPVLLGPLSFLYLSLVEKETTNVLDFLSPLTEVYCQILNRLRVQGVEWIQIDEPILTLDLQPAWRDAFHQAYHAFSLLPIKLLLTTYFGSVSEQVTGLSELPTAGLHLDLCTAPHQLEPFLKHYPNDRVLSLGLVNGRNIWINPLDQSLETIQRAQERFGDRLWIAPSCSLLHVPIDVEEEKTLDPTIKQWLAFAKQKVTEVICLARAAEGESPYSAVLKANEAARIARSTSPIVSNQRVQRRVEQLTEEHEVRHSPFPSREKVQRAALGLPPLPTTTIGSFPQTTEIRRLRRDFRAGRLTKKAYHQGLRKAIAEVVAAQEQLGLDVLVHGESERNDMVEYFGELLSGFVFTQKGWVQSYGSRYVKPPIIYGDVERKEPMTVDWIAYAQSQTKRPVKGMLTGPVTLLAWSFVRDDQPPADTAVQIALALRDEVRDLESAGIKIIQIDEPAFREKLPLKQSERPEYLEWAVRCFRLASSGVSDATQIHTHMCYSDFNAVIEAIAALEADVITIESARSDMKLLKAFEAFQYPNQIGPGVYDIHCPRIPSTAEIAERLRKVLRYIPRKRLWVNPDCGLKTRQWNEVSLALENMVKAAHLLREEVSFSEEASAVLAQEGGAPLES